MIPSNKVQTGQFIRQNGYFCVLKIFSHFQMGDFFRTDDSSVRKQLCDLYIMRARLENRQQFLLIKSLLLTRFIRIASLRHLQNQPSITFARKILNGILPQLQPLSLSENLREIIRNCAASMGNRMN